MTRALVVALTVIVGYGATYLLHYVWHLLVGAPVALDHERQLELDAAAKREQDLEAEIRELRSAPVIDPLEVARKEKVQTLISSLSVDARRFLRHLLTFGELRSAQLRECGVNQNAISEGLSFGRRSGLIQEKRDHPALSESTIWITRDLRTALDAVLRDQNV